MPLLFSTTQPPMNDHQIKLLPGLKLARRVIAAYLVVGCTYVLLVGGRTYEALSLIRNPVNTFVLEKVIGQSVVEDEIHICLLGSKDLRRTPQQYFLALNRTRLKDRSDKLNAQNYRPGSSSVDVKINELENGCSEELQSGRVDELKQVHRGYSGARVQIRAHNSPADGEVLQISHEKSGDVIAAIIILTQDRKNIFFLVFQPSSRSLVLGDWLRLGVAIGMDTITFPYQLQNWFKYAGAH